MNLYKHNMTETVWWDCKVPVHSQIWYDLDVVLQLGVGLHHHHHHQGPWLVIALSLFLLVVHLYLKSRGTNSVEDKLEYSWSGCLFMHSYTCKTEIFLPAVACGVIEFEHIQHSLRVFLLLRFRDVGGLQQPSPLLWHALRQRKEKDKEKGTQKRKWVRAHLIIWLIKIQEVRQIKSVDYDSQETNGHTIQTRQLNWKFLPAFDGLRQVRGSMGKLHQRNIWVCLTHSKLPRDWIEAHMYGVLKVWRVRNLWTLLILVFFPSFNRKDGSG